MLKVVIIKVRLEGGSMCVNSRRNFGLEGYEVGICFVFYKYF